MLAKSVLFHQAPRWKTHNFEISHHLSDELHSWLYETGSLTKRLRAIYGHQFGVKVLYQHWKPAFIDECRLLDLEPGHYQLIREVLLYANQQPLILARTILPAATIGIAQRNLSHLGTRPLGEVIFAYPDLQRSHHQLSQIPLSLWSNALQNQISLPSSLWGRRTVYTIHQHPLLVAEFFLPGGVYAL
ncbi:chorismate lyase [Methylomonas paludis]|uniref:Probable chorismate pyruvate-lyase n=1 Tax=Methylomonas paludis TaxID=1173101 RepID=A0A975R8Z8_9GAMM|nr:chorismate lyase [Methylomonas paludis]QWF69651.1 chorismate lyase [Methylomonas paludis]